MIFFLNFIYLKINSFPGGKQVLCGYGEAGRRVSEAFEVLIVNI